MRSQEAERSKEHDSFTVPESSAGATLAALVREILPGTSWSRARELCSGGRVRVNGAPYDPANFLKAGKYVFKG